jgi:hypothetical protein
MANVATTSVASYREQEQLYGGESREGIITAQLVTVNKKGA